MGLFNKILRPAIFGIEAERAHHLSIKALQRGLVPPQKTVSDDRLKVSIAGLEFPNPLGLAAGYDKNAEVPDAILRLGFGFTEVGTITPRPQDGNPQPRVFRLIEDEAVINRLGFNNQGHEAAFERLTRRSNAGGIVGVNIGANKDSDDFVRDYELGIEKFHGLASYFTANISSPNTPGLRNLQGAEALTELLKRVLAKRDELAKAKSKTVPVFLKIAPDLNEGEIAEIAHVVKASALDGMIISNTTLERKGLRSRDNLSEAGGLSGKPLFERSTTVLAKMRKHLGPELPIIGLGGIDSAQTAIAKMQAGANLVQLYTSMVYKGPGLPSEIVTGLLQHVEQAGLANVSDITGSAVDDWADRDLN